jgi:catechol 2,3-dioxygenase-like lactoylglutathione lyase family enzyme
MNAGAFLGESKLIAFVPTTDYARARSFYEGVLGLRLLEDEMPFALVFDAHGTMLRVTNVGKQHTAAPFTVLGWQVERIESAVERLTASGVEFLRFPGLNEDSPHAIWSAPGGARVAWFHDPDGNVLSVTEFSQPGL